VPAGDRSVRRGMVELDVELRRVQATGWVMIRDLDERQVPLNLGGPQDNGWDGSPDHPLPSTAR